MPASMILPAERPSSSPVPPSESSSSSSVSDEEGPPIPADAEERANPSLWQDKKGEVRKSLMNQENLTPHQFSIATGQKNLNLKRKFLITKNLQQLGGKTFPWFGLVI